MRGAAFVHIPGDDRVMNLLSTNSQFPVYVLEAITNINSSNNLQKNNRNENWSDRKVHGKTTHVLTIFDSH